MTIETAGGGNPKKSDGDKASAAESEASSIGPVTKFVHGSATMLPNTAAGWMKDIMNARLNATAASTNPLIGVTIEPRTMNLRAASTVIGVIALKVMEGGTAAVRSLADGRLTAPTLSPTVTPISG
jgi:hypothetical protein